MFFVGGASFTSRLFSTILALGDHSRLCVFFNSVYAPGRVRAFTRHFIITGLLGRGGICDSVIGCANTDATAVDEIDHSVGRKLGLTFRELGWSM